MISIEAMPEPICKYGYTQSQVDLIIGLARKDEFAEWMRGQTVSLCEGCDGTRLAHGFITYRSDVWRFINSMPVVD